MEYAIMSIPTTTGFRNAAKKLFTSRRSSSEKNKQDQATQGQSSSTSGRVIKQLPPGTDVSKSSCLGQAAQDEAKAALTAEEEQKKAEAALHAEIAARKLAALKPCLKPPKPEGYFDNLPSLQSQPSTDEVVLSSKLSNTSLKDSTAVPSQASASEAIMPEPTIPARTTVVKFGETTNVIPIDSNVPSLPSNEQYKNFRKAHPLTTKEPDELSTNGDKQSSFKTLMEDRGKRINEDAQTIIKLLQGKA
jgi:hypothetical protein